MRNRWQVLIGAIFVFIGITSLIGVIFHINLSGSFFAMLLILLGIFLLLRPTFGDKFGIHDFRIFGDVRKNGSWQVAEEEYWLLLGDTHLDFTTALIPDGETTLHLNGFLGNVRVLIPEGIGLSLSTTAFISDVRFMGHKTDNFLAPFKVQTPGYEEAQKKILLEITHFITETRVKYS